MERKNNLNVKKKQKLFQHCKEPVEKAVTNNVLSLFNDCDNCILAVNVYFNYQNLLYKTEL